MRQIGKDYSERIRDALIFPTLFQCVLEGGSIITPFTLFS